MGMIPTHARTTDTRTSFDYNRYTYAVYSISIFTILISSYGLSALFVLTFSIACTVSSPERTRPKMVCLLSSHGVAFVVMKNWDPFVFGPAFAMLME